MAFAAAGAVGGRAAAGGLFGGRMAAGAAAEGGAAESGALKKVGDLGGMALPGSPLSFLQSSGGTNLTPAVGMKEHTYDVANRDAQS